MTHAHLVLGAAALLAAAVAVGIQSPRAPSDRRASSTPSASAEPVRRSVRSLGPLRVGDRVGDGWTVEGIEVDGEGARISLSGARGKTTLGLLAPSPSDHGIVPLPDLYVTYTGEGTPAVAALIHALVDSLRGAAEGKALHGRVLAWGADAPAP